MADSKISGLTEATAGVAVAADECLIIDQDGDGGSPLGKRISLANLTKDGVKQSVLTANNTLMIRDDSAAISAVSFGTRQVLIRGGSGTIDSVAGRSFLDNVLRGATAITSNGGALNYQPRYNVNWVGAAGSLTQNWVETDTNTLGFVHLYYNLDGDGAARNVRFPIASADFDGDKITVFNNSESGLNNSYDSTPGILLWSDDVLNAPDESPKPFHKLFAGQGGTWQCVENEDSGSYFWYQVGGCSWTQQQDITVVSASLNLSDDNVYCAGQHVFAIDTDAVAITLPEANKSYAYSLRFYIYTLGGSEQATVIRQGTDTITDITGTTGRTTCTLGNAAAGTYAVVDLETRGDGIWHASFSQNVGYTT